MSTIQDLFQQAQLAEAAYADFSITRPLKTALTDTATGGSFSEAQATDFVAHWRVVDQYTVNKKWGQVLNKKWGQVLH